MFHFKEVFFQQNKKITKLIPLYKSGEKTFLQITGQYLYYHNSQQFWRT